MVQLGDWAQNALASKSGFQGSYDWMSRAAAGDGGTVINTATQIACANKAGLELVQSYSSIVTVNGTTGSYCDFFPSDSACQPPPPPTTPAVTTSTTTG